MCLRKMFLCSFVTRGSFAITERVHFVDQCFLLRFFRFFLTYSVMMFVCGKHTAPPWRYIYCCFLDVGYMSWRHCILEWTKYDVPVGFLWTVTPSIYRISRFAGRPGREPFISCKCGRKMKVNIDFTSGLWLQICFLMKKIWSGGFCLAHISVSSIMSHVRTMHPFHWIWLRGPE